MPVVNGEKQRHRDEREDHEFEQSDHGVDKERAELAELRAHVERWQKTVQRAKQSARYFRFLTESDGAQLRDVAVLVEAGKIRPVVDREFAFADLVAAFEYLEAGRAKGKVVLRVR